MPTLHTERGDVALSHAELALYRALAEDRTRTFTMEELCRRLNISMALLGGVACSLGSRCRTVGLNYVENIWGVGYRLEAPTHERNHSTT